MMTLSYPFSRLSSNGQCEMCRGFPGNFENRGIVKLQSADEKEIKLLQWTCNYCGYTMLLDPSVTERTTYRGEGEEKIPDFE
ncbi:MAG: hypothetical protein ACR2MD_15150 [Aridibacter sp.]